MGADLSEGLLIRQRRAIERERLGVRGDAGEREESVLCASDRVGRPRAHFEVGSGRIQTEATLVQRSIGPRRARDGNAQRD